MPKVNFGNSKGLMHVSFAVINTIEYAEHEHVHEAKPKSQGQ